MRAGALLACLLVTGACGGGGPAAVAPRQDAAVTSDATAAEDAALDMAAAGPDLAGDAAVVARTDRQQVLSELVRVVILPAFQELGTAAPALETALAQLRQQPDAATLMVARTAWQRARAAWRRTNAFGVGPGDDLAVTGGIVDEPADEARIERLLSSGVALDLTAVRSQGANLRGFLALEYLLFAPDATPDQVAAMLAGEGGGRRALYLALLGADLAAKLAAISGAWAQSFGREVEQAGRASVAYPRERDAYDAMLNKALAITDRTIDILRFATGGAMGTKPPPLAIRGDNLVEDLGDDLRGLEALDTGRAGDARSTLSLADLVRAASHGVDAEMVRALAVARAAVAALPRPVRLQAPTSAPVTEAIAALRLLKAALSTGVFSVLGISLGFTDNDGD